MTKLTEKLLQELTVALNSNKAVMIKGSSGVGKTYIAKEVCEYLKKSEYNFWSSEIGKTDYQVIPFHSGTSYEDLVNGLILRSSDSNLSFEYKEQIVVSTIKKALKDYKDKKEIKYILIMDDIQRNDISNVLGEIVNCLGYHGNKIFKVKLNNGTDLEVPPNFYIIATYNTSEQVKNAIPQSVYKRFYVKEVFGNIRYLTEDSKAVNTKWFEDIRTLTISNLCMQYKNSSYEQKRYVIGHGCFLEKGINNRIKYQVIPILKQYLNEGILDKKVLHKLEELEKNCDKTEAEITRNTLETKITNGKKGVTPKSFIEEGNTADPLENLLGRIIEQGLISDNEIKEKILMNSNVCYRKQIVEGVYYHAHLVAGESEMEKMRRFPRNGGNNSDKRRWYNKNSVLTMYENHCEKNYYFTAGMQPREYKKEVIWDENQKNEIGETTSPNTILFGIIKNFYSTLINNYSSCTESDEDIEKLCLFAQKEWDGFLEDYKEIKPARIGLSGDVEKASKDASANLLANKELRSRLAQLVLIWSDVGSDIKLEDNDTVKLKGANKIMKENMFKKYISVMDTLEIRQMILQGPPGTSKTYAVKEFLKYTKAGIDNEDFCSSEQLDEVQINDYGNKCYCKYLRDNADKPSIAWDIVQFHPSYGYEDFIRGIEVSTNDKNIDYKTVNKILGKIAKLAIEQKDSKTKFFLIIDEINRANLATVFGELIYGLEYRNDKVATPYVIDGDNKISLPDNLYILGTMNTADKSIGGIDYAIRRRFLFFSQLPDKKVIQNYKKKLGEEQVSLNNRSVVLFENIEKLFSEKYLSPEYRKEDVQIGHTYFLVDSIDQLKMRFIYQIVPILKEYFKDGILNIYDKEEDSGFDGLLNCIVGKINLSDEDEVVHKILEDLSAKSF